MERKHTMIGFTIPKPATLSFGRKISREIEKAGFNVVSLNKDGKYDDPKIKVVVNGKTFCVSAGTEKIEVLDFNDTRNGYQGSTLNEVIQILRDA